MSTLSARKIQRRRWHYIHKRERSPFFTYLIWQGASHHYDKAFSFPYEVDGFVYLNGEIAVDSKAWQEKRRLILRELQHNPSFLVESIRYSYQVNKRVDKLVRQIAQQVNVRSNRHELLKLWMRYLAHSYRFGAVVLLPLFVEQDIEDRLKMSLAERFGQVKVADLYHVVSTPQKEGTAALQQKSLWQLAIQYQKGNKGDQGIQQFMKRFGWTKNNAFTGQFWSADEIRDLVKQLAQSNSQDAYTQYQTALRQMKMRMRDIQEQLIDHEDVTTLIETLQQSIYFRSWRTERYYYYSYFLRSFFAKTAEVLDIANADLFWLTPPEIVAALSDHSSVASSNFVARRKGYGMLFSPQRVDVAWGGAVSKMVATVRPDGQELATKVQGHVSYPGKVVGRARVIVAKSQIHTIAEGDILIAPSTTVDYVPALKKVRGIVTDEGGVLSHASVISRELRIPCIIGTKIATTVFQDGDMVEVDANTGIVRKIEN